jgi:hypothetical protein
VFAAGARVVGVVDEDVIVAGGADYAVDGFVELIVARVGCGVIFASLLTADGHLNRSVSATASSPSTW